MLPRSSGWRIANGVGIVTYLVNHPEFRRGLFGDSTKVATLEKQKKTVTKDGKAQQCAVPAKHVFEADPAMGEEYALLPMWFATSVQTRL